MGMKHDKHLEPTDTATRALAPVALPVDSIIAIKQIEAMGDHGRDFPRGSEARPMLLEAINNLAKSTLRDKVATSIPPRYDEVYLAGLEQLSKEG
jgi:hypothetical protein